MDWVKFGLAGLIDWAIRLLKAKKQPFNVEYGFGIRPELR